MIEPSDVTVELRLSTKPDSQVKAFADVTLAFGESGELTTFGWSVVGTPIRVVPPARKGDKRFFDVVAVSGKLKALIYTSIGLAYKQALAEPQRLSQ